MLLRQDVTATGVAVTHESALRVSVVYACIRVLAETLAQLPIHIYERVDGGNSIAREHPLYSILHRRPNHWQTSFQWRETMQGHVALRGNAYAFVTRIRTGPNAGLIREILPIHPDRVEVEQDENWVVTYKVRMPNKAEQTFAADRILHIAGLGFDGVKGVSPVQLHREAVALTAATERHGAKMFANGTSLGGVLKHPAKLSDMAHGRLKESLESQYAGVENAFKTLILEEGMDWQTVGMTSEDAQFIETRGFQVEEICRIFRVPLVLVQRSDKASTYASAEQFFLSFVKFTMAPWLSRWEETLTAQLIPERQQERFYVEFNVDGLLRGEQKARYEAFASAITNGWMTRNEVRAKENLNPLDGLDEPTMPLNMATPGEETDADEQP